MSLEQFWKRLDAAGPDSTAQLAAAKEAWPHLSAADQGIAIESLFARASWPLVEGLTKSQPEQPLHVSVDAVRQGLSRILDADVPAEATRCLRRAIKTLPESAQVKVLDELFTRRAYNLFGDVGLSVRAKATAVDLASFRQAMQDLANPTGSDVNAYLAISKAFEALPSGVQKAEAERLLCGGDWDNYWACHKHVPTPIALEAFFQGFSRANGGQPPPQGAASWAIRDAFERLSPADQDAVLDDALARKSLETFHYFSCDEGTLKSRRCLLRHFEQLLSIHGDDARGEQLAPGTFMRLSEADQSRALENLAARGALRTLSGCSLVVLGDVHLSLAGFRKTLAAGVERLLESGDPAALKRFIASSPERYGVSEAFKRLEVQDMRQALAELEARPELAPVADWLRPNLERKTAH